MKTKALTKILFIVLTFAALAGAQTTSQKVDTIFIRDTVIVNNNDTVIVKVADDENNKNIEIIKSAERIETSLSFIYWLIGIFISIFLFITGYNIYKSYKIDKELEKAKEAREDAQQAQKNAEEAQKVSKIEIKKYRNEALKAANKAKAYSFFINGNILSKEGKFDEAIIEYTRAIKLFGKNNPNYAEAYYNRGFAKDDKGDYDGAIADYTKAIELKPGFADAYSNRGVAKYEIGDYDGAIADYTKAIELYTDDEDKAAAYHNRGVAKSKKGENAEKNEEKRKWYEEAIADFKEAIRLNPNNESAKKMLESLEESLKNM